MQVEMNSLLLSIHQAGSSSPLVLINVIERRKCTECVFYAPEVRVFAKFAPIIIIWYSAEGRSLTLLHSIAPYLLCLASF